MFEAFRIFGETVNAVDLRGMLAQFIQKIRMKGFFLGFLTEKADNTIASGTLRSRSRAPSMGNTYTAFQNRISHFPMGQVIHVQVRSRQGKVARTCARVLSHSERVCTRAPARTDAELDPNSS